MPFSDWNRVQWSDETTIELYGHAHPRWVLASEDRRPLLKITHTSGEMCWWIFDPMGFFFASTDPGVLVKVKRTINSLVQDDET